MTPDPYRPPSTPRRPRRPQPPAAAESERAAEEQSGPAASDGQSAPQNQAPPTRQYTRYRARPRLFGRGSDRWDRLTTPEPGERPARAPWRERATPKRVLIGLAIAIAAWLLLSLVLFVMSAELEQQGPSGDVGSVLDSAGFPLWSANNILVLGSDQRTKRTHEPGASTSGPSRSDVIMLIRTGAGHGARLSIPRDTVVEIPGHGEQKINAAYAIGGPGLAIRVVKSYLGIPINHVVEMNFANFPNLIDAMGGVDLKTPCVISFINGGFRNGGYTLRLRAGTHHLSGKQALALARTRRNACRPGESDLTRAMRQQQLFQAMKSRLTSPSIFFRLPWVSWDAPEAIRSDMSAPTLMGLFAALATGGSPPTRLLAPSGLVTLPDGSVGLHVSVAERRAAVSQFMRG